MNATALLSELLLDGRRARPAGEGIWSVLPANTLGQRYDRRAAMYDRVVGSAIYNRLLWGSSPRSYSAFAQQAMRSASGPLLDAGSGSLVFTAEIYARTERPLVLVDQSIGMLEAARARLLRVAGRVPDGVVLLQGDLRDIPFRPGSFATVLCMGMLHLFEDVSGVVLELVRVAAPGGQLFLTSLVAERTIGKHYLALLHRAGEVARPRTQAQLLADLRGMGSVSLEPIRAEPEGSMTFVVASNAAQQALAGDEGRGMLSEWRQDSRGAPRS